MLGFDRNIWRGTQLCNSVVILYKSHRQLMCGSLIFKFFCSNTLKNGLKKSYKKRGLFQAVEIITAMVDHRTELSDKNFRWVILHNREIFSCAAYTNFAGGG